MSDTTTKDQSRTPRMLAVLAVAGLFMTANFPTLAAEHSTVDAPSSWTASIPTAGGPT